MAKVERTITINTPVEKVFSYITGPRNELEFIPSITDVRDIIGQGLGQRYGWTYKMMGLPLKGEALVIEHSPNNRRVERTTGGVLSTWTWTFKRTGGSTLLNLVVEYTIPIPVLGKVSEQFLIHQNEREADMVMANIKARMEEYMLPQPTPSDLPQEGVHLQS